MQFCRASDRANEQLIGTSCALVWDWEFRQERDRYAPVDGYFYQRDRLEALFELKVRRMRWTRYPTIILSAAKAEKITALAGEAAVLPVFVVWATYDGDVRWVDVERVVQLPVVWGGRTVATREEAANDFEWIYEIPTDWFQPWTVTPTRFEGSV